MAGEFADRLVEAIARTAPVCVGIDPVLDYLPPAIRPPADATAAQCLDRTFDFCASVLRLVAGRVAAVKFQSAYFEVYRAPGVKAYYSLVEEAKSLGLVTIGDVKRGDIGSTSAAYATAHLTDGPLSGADDDETAPDAITVNPFCGLDTIDPFVKTAAAESKGLFVLVRTSNPGSAALQDVPLASGKTYSQNLADLLAPVAAEHVGQSGWSSIGAVVGATQPQTMSDMRARLPKSIFLLPGYGVQGATAEMTRQAFSAGGKGALVSASRSVLYAYKDAPYAHLTDWKLATDQAVKAMIAEIGRVLS